MSRDLSIEQWHQLLALLSLDCVRPFFEKMQVPIPVHAQPLFMSMLRETILAARQQYDEQPETVPNVAVLLFERMSPSVAIMNLKRWASGIFLGYHADQPEWSVWEIIFSHWAYSRSDDLRFLPADKARAIVDGFRGRVETDDVKEQGQKLLMEKLSDWDIQMFGMRGYGISWESSPFHVVEAIVRIQRLKVFSQDAWSGLSADEKVELMRCADCLVNKLRVWLPGTLPDLGVLLGES